MRRLRELVPERRGYLGSFRLVGCCPGAWQDGRRALRNRGLGRARSDRRGEARSGPAWKAPSISTPATTPFRKRPPDLWAWPAGVRYHSAGQAARCCQSLCGPEPRPGSPTPCLCPPPRACSVTKLRGVALRMAGPCGTLPAGKAVWRRDMFAAHDQNCRTARPLGSLPASETISGASWTCSFQATRGWQTASSSRPGGAVPRRAGEASTDRQGAG